MDHEQCDKEAEQAYGELRSRQGGSTSGDVTSGQSEDCPFYSARLIYLGTWSVRTLGETAPPLTGAAEWNVLEGF